MLRIMACSVALEAFRRDFGIDTIASLEQTKDDGFAIRATPAFALDTLGTEIGLIGFKLARERRLHSAFLGQADKNALVHRIDRAHGKATQLRDIRGGQFHGKQAQKMSKLGITDFSMAVVVIFARHLRKLACIEHMFAY